MNIFNNLAAKTAVALTALTMAFTPAANAGGFGLDNILRDVTRELDRNARHDERQDRRLDRLEDRRGGHQRPRVIYRDRGGARNNDGRDIAIGLGTAIVGGIIANGINGGGARGGQVVTQRGSGGLYIETPCDKAATALNNAINNAEYDGFVSVQEGNNVIAKERAAERKCGPINIPSHYDAYRR